MIPEKQPNYRILLGDLEAPIHDIADMQYMVWSFWQDQFRIADKDECGNVRIELNPQEMSCFDFALANLLRRSVDLKKQWNDAVDGKAVRSCA